MANYTENFKNKLDWAMPFQRTGAFPLDRTDLFSTYADAELYAQGGADSRGLSGTSYVGQIIVVYENDAVAAYIIDPTRNLIKLASTTASGDLAGDVATLQSQVAAIQTIIGTKGEDSELTAENVWAALEELNDAYKAADAAFTEQVSGIDTRLGTAETKITTLESKITGVFHFKGQAPDGQLSNVTEKEIGDVYLVGNKEYVWDGNQWVEFGDTMDLSAYATIAAVDEKDTAVKTELKGNSDTDTQASETIAGAKKYADAKATTAETNAKSYADSLGANYAPSSVTGRVDALETAVEDLGEVASLDKVDEAHLATALASKINGKADKASTLEGYGITDAYTKSATDTLLSAKANSADLGTMAAENAADYTKTAELAKTYATKVEAQGYATTAKNEVIGTGSDGADALTIYGAKAAAQQASTAAAQAQAKADAAVVANAPITGGTKTKITYDAKGLVTAGADLAASDIPTLEMSKINGLEAALAGKQPTIPANTYDAYGAAAQVKTEVIGTAKDPSTANTIYGAKAAAKQAKDAADAAQAQANENAEAITNLEDGITSNITAEIEKLDYTDSAVNGQYVSAVNQVDGIISVTRAPLPDYTNVYDAKGAAAQAETNAKSYADSLAENYDAAGTAQGLINGLDVADTAVDGQYVSQVTQTDGKIKVTRKALPAGDVYSITKEESSADYAAVYHLTKNGENTGTAINIPKDMVVSSGQVVTNPADQPEGTYIELTLANSTGDKLYINVGDLIEYVTGGATAEITVSVDELTHVATATINNGSIAKAKLTTEVQASLTKADSAVQSVTEGSANGTIAVNGSDVAVHGLGTAAYANATAFETAGAANTALTEAKAYTDQAKTAAAADATNKANTAETNAKAYADGLVGALDVTDTAVSGQYVSAVSETDGKIKVTRAALPDYTEVYDAKGAAAQALTDAKAYADSLKLTWGSF